MYVIPTSVDLVIGNVSNFVFFLWFFAGICIYTIFFFFSLSLCFCYFVNSSIIYIDRSVWHISNQVYFTYIHVICILIIGILVNIMFILFFISHNIKKVEVWALLLQASQLVLMLVSHVLPFAPYVCYFALYQWQLLIILSLPFSLLLCPPHQETYQYQFQIFVQIPHKFCHQLLKTSVVVQKNYLAAHQLFYIFHQVSLLVILVG